MQMQIIIDRFLRSEKSRSLQLKPLDKLLLFFLASYCGSKNECWPSYEALMADCAMAKPSLTKCIKKLESSRLIWVTRKYKTNNHYSFNLEFIYELEKSSGVHFDEVSSSFEVGSGVHIVTSNNIINNIINNIKENYASEDQKIKAEEARTEIRKLCHLKRS